MADKKLTGDDLAMAYEKFLNETVSGPRWTVEDRGSGWLKVRRVGSLTDGQNVRASRARLKMAGWELR